MPMIVELSNAELTDARRHISEYAGWFIGIGVLLALLGILAIAFPLLSTVAAAIWVGWMFLVGGGLMLLHSIFAWRWPGSAWNVFVGLLYIAAGAWILYAPLSGIVSLTIVIAALFLAEGVAEIVMALRVRPLDGWGWLLFSGVAGMAAGGLIAYDLPSSAVWALGLLLGLNLLSTGLSFVFLAVACRQATTTRDVPRKLGRADLKTS